MERRSRPNMLVSLTDRYFCLESERLHVALGRWTAVKVFWKAMLFCMILNWAAMNDGVSTSPTQTVALC